MTNDCSSLSRVDNPFPSNRWHSSCTVVTTNPACQAPTTPSSSLLVSTVGLRPSHGRRRAWQSGDRSKHNNPPGPHCHVGVPFFSFPPPLLPSRFTTHIACSGHCVVVVGVNRWCRVRTVEPRAACTATQALLRHRSQKPLSFTGSSYRQVVFLVIAAHGLELHVRIIERSPPSVLVRGCMAALAFP